MEINISTNQTDILLIVAGIMSAKLAVMLKDLDPSVSIISMERLDVLAGDSSDALNNAGADYSAVCELNYAHEQPDGRTFCRTTSPGKCPEKLSDHFMPFYGIRLLW